MNDPILTFCARVFGVGACLLAVSSAMFAAASDLPLIFKVAITFCACCTGVVGAFFIVAKARW